MVYVGSVHPMARPNGWVLGYRLVMAEHLGRYLSSAEHVHHIDLDESNDALENLVLVTASQHSRIHHMIRRSTDPREALRLVLGVAA